MATEWRSNLWLCIQLIIVGLVLWIFSWELLSIWDKYSSDGAFDYRNVYSGSLNYIEDTSPAYVPQPEGHTVNDDLDLILATMRANPYVEEAAYGTNALPYNFNYYGSTFSLPGDTVTPRYSYNNRFMSPEMLRVLRIKGVKGESTEELVKQLENHKVIISQYEKDDFSEKYRGQTAISPYDSSQVFTIGSVIKPFRRNDFEPQRTGSIITLLERTDTDNPPANIAIRLKDGANGRQFLESLNLNDLHVGNVLVYDIKSLESQRESAQRSYWSTIRTTVVGAVFLLVIVFLGFIGTFWFRTRQRRSEIAVRKVNGATDGDIYRRLFSEGLMILVIAVIVSAPIAWLLIKKVDPYGGYVEWLCWPSFIVSAAAMALMIIVGVWFPARNAVSIEPAEALHEE